MSKVMGTSAVSQYARKYLVTEEGPKCGRHCGKPLRFARLLEDQSKLVGAYVCPEKLVTRVVYFSLAPDGEWFAQFLKSQIGERLRKRDLRIATRHGWELGREAEREAREVFGVSGSISEYYWTFYALNEGDKKFGTFLCSSEAGGCGRRLFTKLLSEIEEKLCTECRTTKGKK